MTTGVIYARVSSIGDRQSTERQVKDLSEYAKYKGIVSIRPRACFFPLFSFLPLWLHYNLNPLCVQY